MKKRTLGFKYLGGAALIALITGVSACGGLPVSNVVNLTSKTGSQGDQFITVRARILDGKSSQGSEVADAKCKLTLGSITKSFNSPAKIRVPRNGAASGSLAVRCSYEGYRPSVVTSAAINKSAGERTNVASQAGLLGVLVIGAAGGFSDKKNDVYGYKENIIVTMSKE